MQCGRQQTVTFAANKLPILDRTIVNYLIYRPDLTGERTFIPSLYWRILTMLRFYVGGVFALIAALSATVALSQAANFGTLTLSPGFPRRAGVMRGTTGGAYSLSSIANRDRNNSPCIGFGDTNPDHIMVLEKDFPNLTVQVNTRGKDSTLVIQGPKNNTIRCGDDTGADKDASIQGSNWESGRYKIWVGSFEANRRWNYVLTVQE